MDDFKNSPVIRRDNESDVYFIAEDDPEMKKAREKACLTLWYFKSSLRKPKLGQGSFSVKACIKDGEAYERIWLREVSLDDDGIFYGIVDNLPLQVNNIRRNLRVGVEESAVSDWLIIDRGRLIGGYTIRCIHEKLNVDRHEYFDEGLGCIIDAGVDYFKPDLNTPEGAVLRFRKAVEEYDLEKARSCRDFEAEALLALQSKEGGFDAEDVEELILMAEAGFAARFAEERFHLPPCERTFDRVEWVSDDLIILEEHCFFYDQDEHPDKAEFSHTLFLREGKWRIAELPLQEKENNR